MSTFPTLQPSTRTYTPGQHPASNIPVLTGDETSVRHTNASTNYILRLGFNGLTPEQHLAVNSHYLINGRFQPFDLPDSVLFGANFQFPSGYQWIYANSPQTTYSPGVVTLTVELQLIPSAFSPILPVLPCPVLATSGQQGTFTQVIDMGTTATGTFDFTYVAFFVPDRFIISGAANYDSGVVSGTDTVSVAKTGSSRFITVKVEAPTFGTRWEYSVNCLD
jgi:hypothetical protein